MLFGDGKPQRAAAWPAGRMKRAVPSITFGNPERPWDWFYPSLCGLLGDMQDKLAAMRANQDELRQGRDQWAAESVF